MYIPISAYICNQSIMNFIANKLINLYILYKFKSRNYGFQKMTLNTEILGI